MRQPAQAVSSYCNALRTAVANSIGSTMDGSSFSGLLTRVEIGQIRMGLAGNGRINSRGRSCEPAGIVAGREDQGHAIVDVGNQFIGIRRDNREGANHLPEAGSFQFSQRPPMPNGLSSFMAIA